MVRFHPPTRLPITAMIAWSCLAGFAGWVCGQPYEVVSPALSQFAGAPPVDAVDLDAYYGDDRGPLAAPSGDWFLQSLPAGLIYRSYLAGPKEPRLSGHIVRDDDLGWMFDASLGARVGILRYGTVDPLWPVGFQIDVEGAAQLRLSFENEMDLQAADFRAGVPITFGAGRHRTKFAYYHLSSHAGDEFLLDHPGFTRLNYSRDVLVLGHSVYVTNAIRVYGEAGWAFYTDVGDPWEFQFGLEYAAPCPTGTRGAPFFATNAHLRQEVQFGGTFVAQTGWAWRGETGSLFRVGVHYQNGESNQFSFFDEHEQQVGIGVWYDF